MKQQIKAQHTQEAKAMAHHLGAHSALPKNLGSILSTQITAICNPILRGIQHSLQAPGGTADAWSIDIHAGKTSPLPQKYKQQLK